MLFAEPTIVFSARLAPALRDVLRPGLKAQVTHGEPVDPEIWRFLELCVSVADFLGSSVSADSSTPSAALSDHRSTKDLAAKLGVTERRVRQMCASGKLPARKWKGHWHIDA